MPCSEGCRWSRGTGIGAALAPLIIHLLGTTGALVVTGLFLPFVAAVLWLPQRRREPDARVAAADFRLLRANPIFAPLSIATLEGLAVQLDRRRAAPGEMIVASFGEIALLRDVPRTATVLAVEATELRALSHERFLLAVTGEPDSHDAARQLADRLLTSPQAEVQYPSLGAIHLHASGFKFGAWQSIHAQ